MKIRWFGHSCFYIISNKGTRILTDPFDSSVGYDIPNVETDFVTVSHSHYDHDNIKAARGKFKVFSTARDFEAADIQVKGTATFHDEVGGKKRGPNIVFNMKIDDLLVCHLGDIGHILDSTKIRDIGQVDILLIPVGGIYTINASEAKTVIELLKPKVIIPMHYQTEDLSLKLNAVEEFTEKFAQNKVVKMETIDLEINNISQYEGKIILMKYK